MGGRRESSLKIIETSPSTLVLGKTGVSNESWGTDLNIWGNYGPWKPALDAELLYENAKAKKYTLSNGLLKPKQHSYFLQGQLVARLDFNKFDIFQPYVKAEYQNTLRRSKNYLIQN